MFPIITLMRLPGKFITGGGANLPGAVLTLWANALFGRTEKITATVTTTEAICKLRKSVLFIFSIHPLIEKNISRTQMTM